MKLTLKPSTGIDIVVWRDDEMFHARRASEAAEPQICLGVDLFEVIAELAELHLDDAGDASEAVLLAGDAQLRLREGAAEDGWPAPDSAADQDWRRSS